MNGPFEGRVFSYPSRGVLPVDVTKELPVDPKGSDLPRMTEPLFGAWHGPMCCEYCELVFSTVIPVMSREECLDVDAWWSSGARRNLFPRTIEGELCPKCEKPTLRYYHLDGWYDGRYAVDRG